VRRSAGLFRISPHSGLVNSFFREPPDSVQIFAIGVGGKCISSTSLAIGPIVDSPLLSASATTEPSTARLERIRTRTRAGAISLEEERSGAADSTPAEFRHFYLSLSADV
jgi:hypothetical protein